MRKTALSEAAGESKGRRAASLPLAIILGMQPASLDLLEKTQLPPSQARAILQAMELEITAHEVGFCSRAELKDAVNELVLKIESVRSELSLKIEREIRASELRQIRFTVTVALAQTAIMAGALYFSLGHYHP
jgi:hypothetical protein